MKLIPSTRRGMLGRFAVGAAIIVAFVASATAVAGLLQFKQFASDLALSPAIKHAEVTIADAGNPQTLLLIGSDHRIGESFKKANTDTMMLVRLDPNSSTINLLSIPRDLQVQLPRPGGTLTDKINATYSIGGPNLLMKVLQQQVFPGLQVNHIIDVNFGGFQALVDAVGCVYSDVDRRYYNNTAVTNYSSIDIEPGYQKLCGPNALAFVRFRHTDNDIVRNARQQDFLRWAKAQYGPSQLIANRDKLLKIFGAHTETDHDLHTVDGLINLFNLVAFSAGHSTKDIPFPAVILPCGPAPAPLGAPQAAAIQTPCYVTADSRALRRTFAQFMTPTKAAARAGGGVPATASHSGHPAPRPKLVDASADGQAQAAALATGGLPVYYPRLIATGSSYCTSATCPTGPQPDSYPRLYKLRDGAGHLEAAYRMTLVVNAAQGEFYGVQGTTWQDPPILASPSETRTVAGKRLLLYTEGQKLTLVAWKTTQRVYWVSNTLTNSLSRDQLVGIAASLTRAGS